MTVAAAVEQQQPQPFSQMVVHVQEQQQQVVGSSSRRGSRGGRRRRRGGRRVNRGGAGASSNNSQHHNNNKSKATTISDFLFLKDGSADTGGDDNETCTTCSWDGSSDSSSDDSSLTSSSSSSSTPSHRSRCALHVPPSTVPPLEEQQRYVALDCELVGVGVDGRKSMVARVTLVGWNGETIWDEFIQPTEEVTDYRTYVSGITPNDLLPHNAKFTFQECQEHLREILTDKILVGHALKNDLRALQITHPWQRTRDTGRYEPFMKTRDTSSSSILWPRKLRELVHEKLDGREIQVVGKPHSSYEDAVAAMDLYKLVRTKWEKVMEYKIERTRQIELEQQQQKQQLQKQEKNNQS